MTEPTPIDLDRLLKLRLVVGRYGEMDGARWWNTGGVLGGKGRSLLGRGFPRTHRFAQARLVLAVARARCQEVFDPPGCITLWNLPADLEDQLDAQWQGWPDAGDRWEGFFASIEQLPSEDLLETLREFELLDNERADVVSALRRSAEGKAVPLPATSELDDEVVTLLAAGFSRGEPGKPAIPYAKLAR